MHDGVKLDWLSKGHGGGRAFAGQTGWFISIQSRGSTTVFLFFKYIRFDRVGVVVYF